MNEKDAPTNHVHEAPSRSGSTTTDNSKLESSATATSQRAGEVLCSDEALVGERIAPLQDVPPQAVRQFKVRHIQMIAMASNIGTGLFVATGDALRNGGPGSLLVSFILLTVSLSTMMQSLCEMSVILPIPGSFTRYSTRFVDPALGFASAWLYWACWIGAFGVEAVAANYCIQYWTHAIPVWAVVLIFIFVNVLIHIMPVVVFGEVEFIVSTLKVLVVFGVIVMCWVIMAGGSPNHEKHGGEYWHDPGAFLNGFKGIASTFVLAAFSCGGTEITGVVSGEAYMPKFSLPRGIKTYVFRMIFFYVTSLLFIGFVVSPNDPALVSTTGSKAPFVVAALNGDIKVVPHIINAIILIAVTSVASCSVYISSRVLQSMGEDSFAPKIFAKIDKKGRPTWALAFSGLVAIGVAFINAGGGSKEIFNWLTALSGTTFFFIWAGIVISAMRFRQALKRNSDKVLDGPYAYKNPWYPYNCYFSLISFAFMLVCQLYVAISPIEGKASAYTFFQAALPIPVFVVLYGGYKIYGIYWLNQSWLMVPLHEIDLVTGRMEDDPNEEAFINEYRKLSRWQRFQTYIPFLSDYAS